MTLKDWCLLSMATVPRTFRRSRAPEVEGVVGGALDNRFDLILGTSTGAINQANCFSAPVDLDLEQLQKGECVQNARATFGLAPNHGPHHR